MSAKSSLTGWFKKEAMKVNEQRLTKRGEMQTEKHTIDLLPPATSTASLARPQKPIYLGIHDRSYFCHLFLFVHDLFFLFETSIHLCSQVVAWPGADIGISLKTKVWNLIPLTPN
ncbi:unnamed protein product (mitochondrion) [Musa textilis]